MFALACRCCCTYISLKSGLRICVYGLSCISGCSAVPDYFCGTRRQFEFCPFVAHCSINYAPLSIVPLSFDLVVIIFASGTAWCIPVLSCAMSLCDVDVPAMHTCNSELLQVLMHVAERLKALHACGYVHRDIKPANIMWLPRQNRWTIIGFDLVARINEVASMGFSLPYAAPEVLMTYSSGQTFIQVSEALDAWSLGILSIELFTGNRVFDANVLKEAQVCTR
jgi:Protein kinase domain